MSNYYGSDNNFYYGDCTTTTATSVHYGTVGYPVWPTPQPQVTYGMVYQTEPKKEEAFEMQQLYRVYLVYAEDRLNPLVMFKDVVAVHEEDAKIKSGLMAEIKPEWDADYLTIYADEIFQVKVKPKPKEVKQV